MRIMRVVLIALTAPPVFLLAAACAAAGISAQWGRSSLIWDVPAHFAPVWLLGSLAALAAGQAFRGGFRVVVSVIAGVGVLASGALMAPELIRSTGPRAPANSPGQIKVVQLNAWVDNQRLEQTVAWLKAEDPDFILLEEAPWKLRRMIRTQLRMQPSCRRCDELIFAKTVPVSEGVGAMQRGYIPLARATYRDAGGEFTVIAVHNAWPTDQEQERQERRLADIIALSPRERTIVAGDFNSAPWSFARRRWDAEFGLIRRDRGIFTWPARPYRRWSFLGNFPFLAIAHIYAGSGWATVEVRRGPRIGSDHYPVVAILAPVARPSARLPAAPAP